MARKGDKTALEPSARSLFADGCSLQEISDQLGVSITTLSNWKTETLNPATGIDEWERARQQKGSFRQRMRDLLDEQMEYFQGINPEDRTSAMTDTLSKLGALVERFDKMDAARKVADQVEQEVTKAGLSRETVREIKKNILGLGE